MNIEKKYCLFMYYFVNFGISFVDNFRVTFEHFRIFYTSNFE